MKKDRNATLPCAAAVFRHKGWPTYNYRITGAPGGTTTRRPNVPGSWRALAWWLEGSELLSCLAGRSEGPWFRP